MGTLGQEQPYNSLSGWFARNIAHQHPMPPAQPVPQPAPSGMLPASDEDLYRYYNMRNSLPADSPLHAQYGPMEHGQAMREIVGRNPAMAVPLGLVGIPGYTLGKAAGMLRTRSPASLAEMLEAYKGVGRGLEDYSARIAPQVARSADPDYVPGAAEWLHALLGRLMPSDEPDATMPPAIGPLQGMVNGARVPNPRPARLTPEAGGGVRG